MCEIIKYSEGRVWRYQRGTQNPYIEAEQTAQWLKEKVQKDKQRSTKQLVSYPFVFLNNKICLK